MVNQTSRTLVMSAVPKVTRTRYCAAAATCRQAPAETLAEELGFARCLLSDSALQMGVNNVFVGNLIVRLAPAGALVGHEATRTARAASPGSPLAARTPRRQSTQPAA